MTDSATKCVRCGGEFTQVDPDDELCAPCIQVVITEVEPRVTTYEEWRVTGTWDGSKPYDATWTPAEDGDAEEHTEVCR